MRTVNIHEAKTHLSRLVEQVERGEEIIIARNGTPVARLVALTKDIAPRVSGSMHGQIRLTDDFNAPLPPEVLAGFTGDT